ncbi:hypothetical protein HPP92_009280 [Vanilla planifolia]|uniref:Uncharacterized protein n=1 Tax=Vanilla planifolia TaxID=51239 RepID=A0A835V6T7_VANPL|nr:hypothetical protein HPP92_009280 [Vanilla planifolia]
MEEFSFPEVTQEKEILYQFHLAPHYASPPLWFLSSNSDHKTSDHNHHGHRQQSRSFSSVEGLMLQDKISLTEISDEERMDKLWENFNEELHQIPCDGEIGGKKGSESYRISAKLDDKWPVAGELFCIKAVHRRRPSLMMLLKVFKKLILIQKLRRTRKLSKYQM